MRALYFFVQMDTETKYAPGVGARALMSQGLGIANVVHVVAAEEMLVGSQASSPATTVEVRR